MSQSDVRAESLFSDCLQNTNMVENVKYLLSAKIRKIPLSDFLLKVKNKFYNVTTDLDGRNRRPLMQSLIFFFFEKKGRDLTQSYDKSPYTNRNVKRAK